MKRIHGWPGIIAILVSFVGWLFGSDVIHYLPTWAQDEKFHQLLMLVLTIVASWSKRPSVVEVKEEEPPRRFSAP
jgi:hypothetical protein